MREKVVEFETILSVEEVTGRAQLNKNESDAPESRDAQESLGADRTPSVGQLTGEAKQVSGLGPSLETMPQGPLSKDAHESLCADMRLSVGKLRAGGTGEAKLRSGLGPSLERMPQGPPY